MKKLHLILLFLLTSLCFISCGDDDTVDSNDFGIFEVVDENTLLMNGDITSNTLAHFNNVIAEYPNINKINMNQCPGSTDDEINLQVAKRVHDLNIATHILDGGEIASGAVDFFVSGVERTKGSNTSIGVHSWSNGNNEATDYPVGHEEHLLYINFYTSVGFTQQASEDFYYFTINSAPAADIHWMTDAEVEQYGILTE